MKGIVKETPAYIPGGTCFIENVRRGDLVNGVSPKLDWFVDTFRTAATGRRFLDRFICLVLEDRFLKIGAEQRVFTVDGPVAACDLTAGVLMPVYDRDCWTDTEVVSAVLTHVMAPAYELVVFDAAGYIVNGVLVENANMKEIME